MDMDFGLAMLRCGADVSPQIRLDPWGVGILTDRDLKGPDYSILRLLAGHLISLTVMVYKAWVRCVS